MTNNIEIKLIATDIDGVWTDGGMFYDQLGNELKRFNTYDGVGVRLANLSNFKVAIITGENTKIVEYRAKKLGITDVYQNVTNKLSTIELLCKKYQITSANIAYIGDDINDLQVFKEVGFSAVPNNAPNYVKKYANIVLPINGGEGAFRYFVEYIIDNFTSISIEELIIKIK